MQAAFIAVLALALSSAPALAEKPEWAGHGKGKGQAKKGGHHKHTHFRDEHRGHIHTYYADEFRGGHCPPGLAKKRNGCMPPGQAKKWHIGKPLPASVVIHDLPPPLVIKLGAPPAGHKYVRVAADILLIAVGTMMVVDAIDDLGRV